MTRRLIIKDGYLFYEKWSIYRSRLRKQIICSDSIIFEFEEKRG